MKRKNKRVDHRGHVSDLLKNPPSDPSSLPLEEMKRRFDKMLEENDKGPFGNSALSQWQLIFGVCVVVGIISLAIVAK